MALPPGERKNAFVSCKKETKAFRPLRYHSCSDGVPSALNQRDIGRNPGTAYIVGVLLRGDMHCGPA